ncbi:MAG: DUF1667 domain-containing protein [Terrisporobacter sp.]
MKKLFTCIICPNGCEIAVEVENNNINKVEGALCKKGREYVNQELTNPQRNIATSVKVINGDLEIVSVRLNKNIPKDRIFEVMEEIKKIEVKAPVKIGDVLKTNIVNLNVDVIATKNIDLKV